MLLGQEHYHVLNECSIAEEYYISLAPKDISTNKVLNAA
jgi:hypothetical protein